MAYQDLQIDWLKCFVAIVETGSLSAAATHIHRSQSAVSMQLKKLEAALGCQLLVRDPRHNQLTTEGQRLLSYARRLLDIHEQTQAAFMGESLSGRIRLGVPDDYAAKYLTPVLRRFAQHYHEVEIQLSCEQSTSLIQKIERHELDLALISREHMNQGMLLFYEPLVWVGSAQFPLWKREPLPLAVYEETSLARRNAINSLALQGRAYRMVYDSSGLAGQIAAVESGLAVAVLTRCSVPKHLSILGHEEGLGPLEPMAVALYCSEAARELAAVKRLHGLLVSTLRDAASGLSVG